MDWQVIGAVAAIGALALGYAVMHHVQQLVRRIEAIEIDRAYFHAQRAEQIDNLAADLYEVRDLVKDLVDFQKSDGRYRCDPNDPRLPAHLRDQTGRDY